MNRWHICELQNILNKSFADQKCLVLQYTPAWVEHFVHHQAIVNLHHQTAMDNKLSYKYPKLLL